MIFIMRVMVDTSVWSLALRRASKHLSNSERIVVRQLREIIIDGRAVLLGSVRQELLTGVMHHPVFEAIQSQLDEFDNLAPDRDDYDRAAAFANRCRANGIATGPVDMLLCSVASARELPIFATDRDFERYRGCLPIQLF